jgi:hypothetical protein
MTTVERFVALFAGADHHGRMSVAKTGEKKKAKTVPDEAGRKSGQEAPLTAALVEGHLEGKGWTLGAVPIRRDGLAVFGAIDLDDHDADHLAIGTKVRELDLPLVVSKSKSGGCHLWLFLATPISADVVRAKLAEWTKVLGLRNPDDREVEIFPKQTSLADGSAGSWINLPLAGDGTDRRVVFGDEFSDDLATFVTMADARRMTKADLLDQGGDVFAGGPTCLQELHATGAVGPGVRNRFLFNAGVFFRMSHSLDWEDRLEEYNKTLDPPLDEAEMRTLIKTLDRKDYSFGECLFGPGRCTSACQDAKFGRGEAVIHSQTEGGKIPVFESLRRMDEDPPYWLLSVNGRDVTLDVEALQNVKRLGRAVLEQLNEDLGSLTSKSWTVILRRLLAGCVTIDPGEETGVFGSFVGLLKEFLATAGDQGEREIVLDGTPWVNEKKGEVWFRLAGLSAFLTRAHRFNYYGAKDLARVLRKTGADHRQVKVAGTVIPVWVLPTTFVLDPGPMVVESGSEIL